MNIPFIRETAEAHAQAMIARFLGLSLDTAGRVTDFNDGSNSKNVFESVGLRFENLDNKVFSALRRAIPVILYEFFGPGDGVTTSVGFPLLPALPATGLIRFTKDPAFLAVAVQIPSGFRVSVPAAPPLAEKVYTLLNTVTIAAGQPIADGLVQAAVSGIVGNTPAGTIGLKDVQNGLLSGANPAAFGSGSEIETDEGRRQRFVVYIRNLARAQYAGLEFGASTAELVAGGVIIEKVIFARAFDVPDKRGLVDLYVDNGAGAASAGLVAAAQKIVDGSFAPSGDPIVGYKAAGIVVVVKAVVQQVLPVTIKIAPKPGYVYSDLVASVQAAVQASIFSVGVFADLIVSNLVCAAKGVLGVSDAALVTPTANIAAATGARILPGVITVQPL